MDWDFLANTPLFCGIPPVRLPALLAELGAREQRFAKGAVLYRAGDFTHCLGLVLSGQVRIENDDVWGDKSILDSLGPGCVFGEAYACAPQEPLMVSAVAAQDADILFLDARRLVGAAPQGGEGARLVQNLLAISAQKNLTLSRRIFHTSPKTIRGRLLSFLSFQAARSQSSEFTIPYNRQQLADYLSVDRSALCHELGKMQREGLLLARKNHFILQTGGRAPLP